MWTNNYNSNLNSFLYLKIYVIFDEQKSLSFNNFFHRHSMEHEMGFMFYTISFKVHRIFLSIELIRWWLCMLIWMKNWQIVLRVLWSYESISCHKFNSSSMKVAICMSYFPHNFFAKTFRASLLLLYTIRRIRCGQNI